MTHANDGVIIMPLRFEIPDLGNFNCELLRSQKRWLLSQLDCPEANGLIHMIDAMQTYAVDVLGLPENEVFDITEE